MLTYEFRALYLSNQAWPSSYYVSLKVFGIFVFGLKIFLVSLFSSNSYLSDPPFLEYVPWQVFLHNDFYGQAK